MENRRKNELESHVAAGDYFDTLATVLDLIRQERQDERLKGIVEDLIYLQEKFKIEEK